MLSSLYHMECGILHQSFPPHHCMMAEKKSANTLCLLIIRTSIHHPAVLLLQPFDPKEMPEHIAAFLLHQSGFHFRIVIESARLIHTHAAFDASAFWITGAVVNLSNTRLQDSAGTHRAWFQGNIQITAIKPPAVQLLARFLNGEDLCMRNRLPRAFPPIIRSGNDFSIFDDDAPDRHFIDIPGFFCLLDCFHHKPV